MTRDQSPPTNDGETAESGDVESDDGYTHEPDGPATPADGDREFGWEGWLLVAVIVVAFLVAPAIILLRPPALSFRFTYLVVPLVPAFLLGAVAVWAAQRRR